MGKTIKAIGCDILALSRFYRIYNDYDDQVLSYLFTTNEFVQANALHDPPLLLAICFAGKEAVSKALGCGMSEVSWNEIEIIPNIIGDARINVYGKAEQLACLKSLGQWELSWKVVDDLICVLVNGF